MKKYIFLGIIGLIVLMSCIAIIPAGHTGVVKLFGKVYDKELSSGIHLIFPLKTVTRMSIRTETYTMSGNTQEGEKKGDDAIEALTKEGLKVKIDVTVLYRLKEEKASDVYKELGENYAEKIIRPQIRSIIRETIATYEAKSVYSEKRAEVEKKIFENLSREINPRGIVIEKVLLRNVSLPAKLAKSIEEKLQAEQEAQRMQFVLEREKKEAERKIIEAQGMRKAQEIINKSLTPAYLKWYSIQMMRELANSQNTTFLFVPIDKNGMPIVNVYPQK